jgi:hypothetical protein
MRSIVFAVLFPTILFAADPDGLDTWNGPSSLKPLWAPIDAGRLSLDAESDDAFVSASNQAEHYRYFAHHTRPEVIIPDMIAELRAHPSEQHFRIYALVMDEWPRDRVVATLRSYEYLIDIPFLRELIPFYSVPDDSEVQIARRFAEIFSESN